MEKQPGKFFFSIVDFQLFDPIEVAILENTRRKKEERSLYTDSATLVDEWLPRHATKEGDEER